MSILARPILGIICLVICISGVHAEDELTPEQAFGQHHWSTTIALLGGRCETQEASRMLAISYFEIQDYQNSMRCIEQALKVESNDIELNKVKMEIMVERQSPGADKQVNKLKALASCDQSDSDTCHLASFDGWRINLRECEVDSDLPCQISAELRKKAKEELGIFIDDEEVKVALRLRAASALIEALLTDGELGAAYQVAEKARKYIHPDPENAIRFEPFIPETQANSRFKYDLGYRYEYDDNVTFPDELFATGQGDSRHVVMADVLYERPLVRDWSFYASGNFLQSFYHDLNEFDRTYIAGSVAIGHMGQKTGWRIPLELTHIRLDGDTFRNSIAVLPGFYIQFGKDFLSHFYARFQRDDYEWLEGTAEDRSGDVAGGGVLLTGRATSRLQVRSYLEYNRYDADGIYWARDEIVAFVHGEFELTSRWQTAFAFRYKREDYDNVRPVFADRQLDKSKEIFLNVTHKFAKNWWWRAQVSLIDHESNIGVFNYNRNIYSIAVTRDF